MAEPSVDGTKIAILGCGKLGIAILQGLLRASSRNSPESQLHVSHVIATAKTPGGVERIQKGVNSLATTQDYLRIDIYTNEKNAHAAQMADILILGCKPKALPEILTEAVVRTMEQSEKRKILVSLAGGVMLDDLAHLYRSIHESVTGRAEYGAILVRAIPNIAASVQQSATVCSSGTQDGRESITHLFDLVGRTEWAAEEHMYSASALCASSLAFYAAMARAVASSASGMAQRDALKLAALAMQGTAALVLAGQSPDEVIDQVATRGGSTEAGLRILEAQGVEDSLVVAVRETTQATGMMGKGVAR